MCFLDNVPFIPTHLCKLVDDKGSLLQPPLIDRALHPLAVGGSSDLLLAGRLVGGVAFGSQPLALLHSLSARPESAQWRKVTKKSP